MTDFSEGAVFAAADDPRALRGNMSVFGDEAFRFPKMKADAEAETDEYFPAQMQTHYEQFPGLYFRIGRACAKY